MTRKPRFSFGLAPRNAKTTSCATSGTASRAVPDREGVSQHVNLEKYTKNDTIIKQKMLILL